MDDLTKTKPIKFKKINTGLSEKDVRNFNKVFNLLLIAEQFYLNSKYDEWWAELEIIWEDEELKKSGYVPLKYLFQGRLFNTLEKDFFSIIEINKNFNLKNESFRIGCIEYKPDEKDDSLKYQLVNSELKKVINDIFLIPDQLIFIQHRVNWEITIPMIIREFRKGKTPTTKEGKKEQEKKDLENLIREHKNIIRSKNRNLKKVTKHQVAKSLGQPKSTFYEITKNIDFDSL